MLNIKTSSYIFKKIKLLMFMWLYLYILPPCTHRNLFIFDFNSYFVFIPTWIFFVLFSLLLFSLPIILLFSFSLNPRPVFRQLLQARSIHPAFLEIYLQKNPHINIDKKKFTQNQSINSWDLLLILINVQIVYAFFKKRMIKKHQLNLYLILYRWAA